MPGPADAEHDLTPFDHEVFRLLQQDGRRSFVAIAEELGVDETRVRRRVEKLIGDDVFSVTIIADPRLLGLDYMAWIGIEAMSASSASVAAALVALPEVKFAARCSGRLNVMAEVACGSAVALQSLLDQPQPNLIHAPSSLGLCLQPGWHRALRNIKPRSV